MSRNKEAAPAQLRAERAERLAEIAARTADLQRLPAADADTGPVREEIRRSQDRVAEINAALAAPADAIRRDAEANVDREFAAIIDRAVGEIAARLVALQPPAMPEKEGVKA